MNRRMVLAGLSAAILAASSVAALAAPCGPAVLSKVDGKVLVNRGVGFLDGKAGMPLAVGDHVMLRGGSAEILFVNGTGSALSGAKSLSISACSADASMLTNPALAQSAGSSTFGFGQTMTTSNTGNSNSVTRQGFGSGNAGGGSGGGSSGGGGSGGSGGGGSSGLSMLGLGAIATAAAVPAAIAATTQNNKAKGTIIAVQPASP